MRGIPLCHSKESCNWRATGDAGSTLGSGRSPGAVNGNPVQYSCLGNPKDRGAWWATVHKVAKSQTWLKQLSTHSLKTWETSQLSPFTGREELTYIEPLLCAWSFIYSILFYSHNSPMTCMLLSLFYRQRNWVLQIEEFAQTHSVKSRGQDPKSMGFFFFGFNFLPFLVKQSKTFLNLS